MNNLIEQVQIRNDEVLRYNSLLQRQLELKGRITDTDLQRREVEKRRARNANPGLPAMAAFVNDLYEQAKERCLYDLYLATRAYVFWSLQPYSLFDDLLHGKSPQEVDYTLLSAGRDRILDKLKEQREKLSRPDQHFNKAVIRLSDLSPSVLQTLKAKNSATFALAPARKGMSEAESPFAGLARVRVNKVRPWAIGLETGEDSRGVRKHHIVLTHLGTETLVGEDDDAHTFTHNPVTTTVIYDSAKMRSDQAFSDSQSITEDGTIDDPEGGATYSQIGPFGKWRISIPPHLNKDLKMGTLQDVEIKFNGGNYTLV